MSAMEFITQLGMILGSLGGLEGLKWLLNRKTNQRIAKVEADILQFDALVKMVNTLQETLNNKETRFQEELIKERELREDINKLRDQINDLTTKIAILETERQMKLCEVRNCPNRIPQTGY